MSFNKVNPPEQLQLPEGESEGMLFFLKNLKFIVFQLWKRVGAGQDYIDSLQNNEVNQQPISKVLDIRAQIGSGIPVSINTTGFTVDNTQQTTDRTEA